MPAPNPKISRDDFEALVRRSGLLLSEIQKGELYGAAADGSPSKPGQRAALVASDGCDTVGHSESNRGGR